MLAFLGGANATIDLAKCLVCEKVGFAATEADAIQAFASGGGNDDRCLNKAAANDGGVTNSDATYCVAQFFIYHAKDMDINGKGYVVF